jgi:1-deoxy-D-xylulose-5-phosphate reductoisomerase
VGVRRISILGATGSVGRSTLDLGRNVTRAFEVVTLTANSDVKGLAEIARRVRPERAVIGDAADTPSSRRLWREPTSGFPPARTR